MDISAKDRVLSSLQALIGLPLRYGLKSPDMQFLDLGFWEDMPGSADIKYAIHLSCGLIIDWKNGKEREYAEDTDFDFNSDTSELIGKTVRRVALSDKNDLWLDLGVCNIIIVTYEDGEESWRFFSPGVHSPHIIATDLCLSVEMD